MSEFQRRRRTARDLLRAGIAGLALALLGASGALAQSADPAQLQVRVDQLESQLRQMTGQVEELNFKVKQLEDRLQRFSEDTEFRFRDLDNSGASNSSSATVSSSSGRREQEQGFQSRQLPPPQFNPNSFNTEGSSSQRGAPPRNLGASDRPRQDSGSSAGPLDLSPHFSGQQDSQAGFNQQPADSARNGSGQVALGVATDAQGEYDIAYAYILQRDYGGAEFAFRNFLQKHPGHRLAGNAQYWLGESFYARKQYRPAADAFLTGYKKYKSSPKAPDSLLKLGMSLQALNQKDAACSTFSELERTFPNASRDVKQRARGAMRDAGC